MKQQLLFTPGGKPRSIEALEPELRVRTLEHFGELFGVVDVTDEFCPSCSRKGVRVAKTPTDDHAFCECGWMMPLGDGGEE